MKIIVVLLVTLVIISNTSAHMIMTDPSPIHAKGNPNSNSHDYDYSYNAPIANYPCKGYHKDLDTKFGTPVATWAAGSSQKFTLSGRVAHGGGSCQASLSYDKGATFTVIKSFIGNCPNDGTFNFKVPDDAPAGDRVLFAWTWYNKVGLRELYMNCASVKITGGAGGAGFNSRPKLFLANVPQAGGCKTTEGRDVKFPNPGPDVEGTTENPDPLPGCNAAPAPAAQVTPSRPPTPVAQNNNSPPAGSGDLATSE